MLLPDVALKQFDEDLTTARNKIMVSSGIIGFAIGAMVMVIFGKFTAKTGRQVQAPLVNVDEWEDGHLKGGAAEMALGGYSRTNVEELEGRYVCFRPTFAKPSIINAYLLTIRWDMKKSCLMFVESDRADAAYVQEGRVCIPEALPFINLLTMDKGDLRLVTVSRPGRDGIGYGLMLTLSNPRGMQFTPASVPIVIRRVGERTPQLGYVHPGAADYEDYAAQLRNVLPNYGVLSGVSVSAE
jgi:hypothetical protein